MTEKEADIILLEALLQTPNSRADYFRIKATEGNYNPVTFYLDLSEAYNRIEQYVNSYDYKAWWYDEKGNQMFNKQFLWLPEYTNGRMTGSLGSENLLELLEPLHEFGISLRVNLLREMALIVSKAEKQEIKIKSFSWTGSDEQKGYLYQELKVNHFIASRTSKEAFTAIFADELKDIKPVKWIASNRLLSYLFYQLEFYHGFIENKQWQSIIEKYKIFKNQAGKYLTAQDLSTALSEINSKGFEPIDHEKIDEILKTLKPLNVL